jgi:hypothetical protein
MVTGAALHAKAGFRDEPAVRASAGIAAQSAAGRMLAERRAAGQTCGSGEILVTRPTYAARQTRIVVCPRRLSGLVALPGVMGRAGWLLGWRPVRRRAEVGRTHMRRRSGLNGAAR